MTPRWPLLLAAFALCACSRSSKDAEPNDSYGQASALPAGGRARGTIASASDTDWYKLSVKADGALSLYLGGIRDVDFVISVSDKDRQELKRFDETGVGGDEEALDLGVRPGDYFVVLSNKNDKANNPKQEYELRSSLSAAGSRESEPDDTPLTAQLIEPNGVTRGHYFPTQNLLSEDKAEEDWYRLKILRSGIFSLNLELSEVPKVDPVLEVYDANAYKLKAIDDGSVGEPETLKDFGVKGPSELLLRLRTKGARSGNQDVAYELLTELLPYEGKAEFEPNDQRLDATSFERDSLVGHVSPAGDADWYRVSLATDVQQTLSASLSGVVGMDLQLTLADELGNPLMAIDNMGKERPEVLTGIGVTQTTYYLLVSEKTGKGSDSRHVYTLTKTLTPWQAGLEYELNDTSATAQAFKVGESVDGYLAPKGDVDFYEFNVYKKGEIVFELTGVLNARFGAALFDQEGGEAAAAAAKKPGESLSFVKELEAGTYWLRLKGEDAGQNNVRDKYTLRIRTR